MAFRERGCEDMNCTKLAWARIQCQTVNGGGDDESLGSMVITNFLNYSIPA